MWSLSAIPCEESWQGGRQGPGGGQEGRKRARAGKGGSRAGWVPAGGLAWALPARACLATGRTGRQVAHFCKNVDARMARVDVEALPAGRPASTPPCLIVCPAGCSPGCLCWLPGRCPAEGGPAAEGPGSDRTGQLDAPSGGAQRQRTRVTRWSSGFRLWICKITPRNIGVPGVCDSGQSDYICCVLLQ